MSLVDWRRFLLFIFKILGIHLIDLRKTWEKLSLAARVLVAIENPKDIISVALSQAGATPYAQRALLKFAKYIGTRQIAGTFCFRHSAIFCVYFH